MPASTTRWNLVVPTELDRSLRQFLAAGGRARKGDLSLFVGEAVSKVIFESTVRQIQESNAGLAAEEVQAIVDESLAWARQSR